MKQKKSWLNGKTIVITGVTGGLGKELTKLLLTRYSAKVIGIARNKEKMDLLVKELNSSNFTPFLFDVSKNAKWEEFSSKIAEKSIKIDVLINNAGIMPPFGRFENLSLERAALVIDTNLFSSVYSCKNLLPILKQSKDASIINISSASAFAAVIGTSMYSASKAALKAFTDALREENQSVYIAGVYPGFIKTELFRDGKLTGKIEKFASDADKTAAKILNKINRKRRHITVGFDGKLLRTFSRIFPNTISRIMTNVLTSSGEENFKGLKDDSERN